jgi:hypothetical protein
VAADEPKFLDGGAGACRRCGKVGHVAQRDSVEPWLPAGRNCRIAIGQEKGEYSPLAPLSPPALEPRPDVDERKPMRRWLRLWPGMQDEAIVLTDKEVIEALGCDPDDAEKVARSRVGDWLCDADGYYVRINIGPLFGNYCVPR